MEKIFDNKNNLVADYSVWQKHYPNGKEKHSAWEFGKFIMNNNGLSKIQNIIEKAIGEKVIFSKTTIEKGVKFDDYQRESQRDMVIEGKTKSGENIFITIEAKVLESFGGTIQSELKAAKIYKKKHEKSQRAIRIEELYEKLMHTNKSIENSDLRYQLFHTAASTAYIKSDIAIMMILDLTNFANVEHSQRNKNDFINFMNALNAKEIDKTNHSHYEAIVFDKTIKCLYVEV